MTEEKANYVSRQCYLSPPIPIVGDKTGLARKTIAKEKSHA
jgi:hypothetical protein